jgi:hypothetical protein
MLPVLNRNTAFIILVMLCVSTTSFSQSVKSDSSRLSISFSYGGAIPLGAFAQSSPEKIVQVYNIDPFPSYTRIENFDRKNSGAAMPGSYLGINFSYKISRKWMIQTEVGFSRNNLNTQDVTNYLNENQTSSELISFNVNAVDYSVLSISEAVAYHLEWKNNGVNFGPLIGLGIMQYPYYEIGFQDMNNSSTRVYKHQGAQPNLTSFLYGGVAEIYHKWNLRLKNKSEPLARLDIGLRISYAAADFTYNTAMGIKETNQTYVEYYEDEINYRVLNLGFRLGYHFN